MAARMEMERLGLGRLERLDLRSFWGEQLPDLTPWFVQNVDLLGQTLGIDITPTQDELHAEAGEFNVLGTDALGRPIVIENRLEEADHHHLGELIMHASALESAVIVWVSPRFDQESRRTLDWLNDRTDSKVDFFGVELGLRGGDVDAERLTEQVDVLHEPGGQVRKLLTPERPQVEPLQAAETEPLHFHSGRHPTPLRLPLERKLYPVLLGRRQTRQTAWVLP